MIIRSYGQFIVSVGWNMSDGAGIWSHLRLRLLQPQCPEDYQCNPHIPLCMQWPLRVHLLSSILYFYKSARTCVRVCVCVSSASAGSFGGRKWEAVFQRRH